ncbi:hypothetical protein BGZ75_007892 [Mortierella antarctica]|nr:hypothetical protein BGZ75_007892 [Mortierella antarctica]
MLKKKAKTPPPPAQSAIQPSPHVTPPAATTTAASPAAPASSAPASVLPNTRAAPSTATSTSTSSHTPSPLQPQPPSQSASTPGVGPNSSSLRTKEPQLTQDHGLTKSDQEANNKPFIAARSLTDSDSLSRSSSLSALDHDRSTASTSVQTSQAESAQQQEQHQPQQAPLTRSIPSTFITLADDGQDPMDDDEDDEDDDDYESLVREAGPARKRTVTTGAVPSTGPYLTTGTVGQRSLSTPNLHADTSLIVSPASSPPASPGLAANATATSVSMPPALSLDGHSPTPTAELNNLVLSLSPAASPNSSPRLAPQKSIASVSGIAAPGTRAANGDRPGNRLSSAGKAKTPPLPEGVKTLKSSKNKTINRSSVVSMFDTTASSMTLPTNFARKGSLPEDAANTTNNTGLAGLFEAQPQDLTSTPFSLTLAEFRLNDIYPRRQRRLLTVLHRMDHRLRKEGVVRKLTKEQLKGKPDKEVLKPDRKSMGKDYAKKGAQGGFMAQRIPAFLRSKKLKKRTRPVILHNIELAIRDKKPELALQYITLLPTNALKKKKKKAYSDLNHCMLLAMIYRMEQVAIELVERGFPIDVNYPIIGKARDEYRTKPGRTGPFEYPSYFIVAVGLGMCNLVRAMIKTANLNQSWCGLTPLLLAVTLNECTNATCPPPTLPPAKLASMLSRGERVHLDMSSQTLIGQLPSTFNKSANTQFRIPGYTPTSPSSIVTTLLEYGADPNQGITLQQYLWASKLKGMGVLSRRRKIVDPKAEPNENPIEFYIAARRHESGRQWLSHAEIKARKAAKAQEAQTAGGKKRFSPEMQEYWKGKWILPVELAIASGNLDCARTILQRLGPQSLASSSFGLLLQNDVMLTLSLIKSGTPVSQHDVHGCTPLHLAARRGHLEMVMVLLQLGGDVNSRGERQWTPLHESISQNHSNISSLLIACGADLGATNDADETPEDVGRRRGLSEDVLAEHLDVTKAKNCSAGLVHTLGNLPGHITVTAVEPRSGASSRRTSHEQLTSNTLKSMMMASSERNASLDQARLSQHLSASLLDLSNGHSPGNRSPLSMSQDNLLQLNGNGSGNNAPLTPSSSSSSLNGSRNSNTDKKKKVRGFLKKIFN